VNSPSHPVEFRLKPGLIARGDRTLLSDALRNLLNNAWKFTAKTPQPRVEFGQKDQDGQKVFFVSDNGAGFNMKNAAKLFLPFERLHDASEYPGNGVGLATVQQIIQRHGGQAWAEGAEGKGATFYFTLP
jgi:light-regulated signal transduction histidine kinase (bacteriophytochrome)